MNTVTEFAPAERASWEELHRQISSVRSENATLGRWNESSEEGMLLLNSHRQIVFANRCVLDMLEIDDPALVYGCRPGEMMRCVHSAVGQGGCGTSAACRMCPAVRAILSSLEGHIEVESCRLIREAGLESLDLLVRALPVRLGGCDYSMVLFSDVAASARRRKLNRIFLHDLLNTAQAIRGITELLDDLEGGELSRFKKILEQSALSLVEEIDAQRQLSNAEGGDLEPEWQVLNSLDLLAEAMSLYQGQCVVDGKVLSLLPESASVDFVTDHALVSRVLGNMVKNALEACGGGETVTILCRVDEGGFIYFSVHNVGVIPVESRPSVFQHSSSLKGVGRGWGTYSIKLLSERYLNGQVGFESSEAHGTTFWARFPMRNF